MSKLVSNKELLKVAIPVVSAHQFYRLFKIKREKELVLLAADALNKTKPTDALKERVANKGAAEPDTVFLLKNLDCLQSIPRESWPKRQLNKTNWGAFHEIMSGLELYLAGDGLDFGRTLTEQEARCLSAAFAFATFDIAGEVGDDIRTALLSEQAFLGNLLVS